MRRFIKLETLRDERYDNQALVALFCFILFY